MITVVCKSCRRSQDIETQNSGVVFSVCDDCLSPQPAEPPFAIVQPQRSWWRRQSQFARYFYGWFVGLMPIAFIAAIHQGKPMIVPVTAVLIAGFALAMAAATRASDIAGEALYNLTHRR